MHLKCIIMFKVDNMSETIQQPQLSHEELQSMQLGQLSSQETDRALGAGGLNGFFERRREAILKGFKIRTIYDMFMVDYPGLFDDAFVNALKKDAPLLSTTTGARVPVHGAEAISWVIQEANAFSLLGMRPYQRGGYRVITTAGATTGGGQAENAAVPSTIKPALVNVDVPIKEVATSFNVSARQEFYSMLEDDVWAEGGSSFEAMRRYAAIEFNKLINRNLLVDNNTLASNNVESIDRVVASKSEIDGVGQDAGDLDIYGLDRDSVTTNDAFVDHNSGTDRDLTLTLVKGLKEGVQPFWGGPGTGKKVGTLENKFWLTGYDTMNRIEQIFESQNTYVNQGARVQLTLNGVETLPKGSDAGFLVNVLYGMGIFVSNDVPKDTISRLYLLDGDHLWMGMGIPTQYFQAGFSKGTPIELDAFQDQGVHYMATELVADRFNVHAKLRDLQ